MDGSSLGQAPAVSTARARRVVSAVPEPVTPGPAPPQRRRCVSESRLADWPRCSVSGGRGDHSRALQPGERPPSSWPFEAAGSSGRADNLISARPGRFRFSLSLPAALPGGSWEGPRTVRGGRRPGLSGLLDGATLVRPVTARAWWPVGGGGGQRGGLFLSLPRG